MQQRLHLGIGILAFFLAAGLFAGIALERVCTPVSQLLYEACNTAADGDLETATALAEQANTKWQRNWNGIASLADHTPMDEIDGLFAQARTYAQMGAVQDFSASCTRLAALIEAVAEAHSLTWWNLV